MSLLFNISIRISVIVLFALVALYFLRRQSAALRHSVLTIAVFCSILVPVLGVIMPALPVLPAAAEIPAAQLVYREPQRFAMPQTPGSNEGLQFRGAESAGLPGEHQDDQHISSIRARDALAWLWAGGVALGLVLLVAGTARMVWLTVRSEPVVSGSWVELAREVGQAYGLRHPIRMFQSRHASVLATWGIVRPEVLLPADAAEWPEDRIRVVLSHELAHIRRRDWPIQVVAAILRSIYWFNPLIWILYRRLRQESEQACDDAVIGTGMTGPEYAAQLLAVARILNANAPAWAPGLLMARPSTLQKRIVAMLNPAVKRGKVSWVSFAAIATLFIGVTLPLAAIRAAIAQPAAEIVLPPVAPTARQLTPVLGTSQVPLVATAQQTGRASVEGIVVRQGTNQPLAGVMVEMRKVPANTPGGLARPDGVTEIISISTGDNGRFSFRNLPPAEYRLVASRQDGSYAPAEYFQKPTRLIGVAFPLRADQALKDVKIEMSATGSISGRIVDRDGEPVGYARVLALQYWYERGSRMMSLVQVGFTNDRGEYRLYWLPAGQYFIAVRPENSDARAIRTLPNVVNIASPRGEYRAFEGTSATPIVRQLVEGGQVIEETYQLVYYGGTLDAQRARAIDVAPGAHVNAIDLSIAPGTVRARTIRGTAINGATGQPANGAQIVAVPRDSSPSLITPLTQAREDGSFVLKGLTAESYYLLVTHKAAVSASGMFVIESGTSDLDNFSAALKAGTSIPGRVSVEGRLPDGTVPDLTRLSVRLSLEQGFPITNYVPNPVAAVAADGSFTLPNVAPADGAFRVAVQGLPAGTFIKAIRFGPMDALNSSLRLGNESTPLEITVGTGLGSIVVVALDDQLKPAVNAMVVLVPEPRLRQRLDLFRARATNINGEVELTNLVPGDYNLFAWEEIITGAWLDADFMRPHENRGKTIRITERNRDRAEISVIRQIP
jgi:beta-lactamase regulating signal transducer with metallopeptidase domain/protocatechuate 3,4-dioxygenase beta subunit